MEHEPGIFEQRDEAAELAADERARADFKAGRFVSHEKMAEWLKTGAPPIASPCPRMAQISWSVQASLQLAAIVDYIEQFDPDAARRLGDRLIDVAESLRQFRIAAGPFPMAAARW